VDAEEGGHRHRRPGGEARRDGVGRAGHAPDARQQVAAGAPPAAVRPQPAAQALREAPGEAAAEDHGPVLPRVGSVRQGRCPRLDGLIDNHPEAKAEAAIGLLERQIAEMGANRATTP
jgi:hypothetical protein